MLASNFGSSAGLVDAGRLFQVLNCCVREALFPKDRDGAIKHTLTTDFFGRPMLPQQSKELICSATANGLEQ